MSASVRGHFHHGGRARDHAHGGVDPEVLESRQGVRTLAISLAVLGATALAQAVVVALTGSVALLADTIHNFGDALTAVPLGAAFILARRPPSPRFPYGLKRTEDLAGLAIVGAITFSAGVALYESILRLVHPSRPGHLLAGVLAGALGFVGNELVAVYRIRQGRKMGSAALVADGFHARVDGLASLSVVIALGAVAAGAKIADPIVGVLVSCLILWIAWRAAREVGRRILDGIEPETLDAIRSAVEAELDGAGGLEGLRARWVGHEIHAELRLAPRSGASAADLLELLERIERRLEHEAPRVRSLSLDLAPVAAPASRVTA